jgi:hypothetical protein
MKLIAIHGMKSEARWFQTLQQLDVWEKTGTELLLYDYGHFSIPQFLNPFDRKRAINKFIDYYNINIGDGELPSLIAHSYLSRRGYQIRRPSEFPREYSY